MIDNSDSLVALCIEAQMLDAFGRGCELADVGPSPLVVGQHQFVGSAIDDVALHARRTLA